LSNSRVELQDGQNDSGSLALATAASSSCKLSSAEPRSTRSRRLPRERSRLPGREPRLGTEDRQRVLGGQSLGPVAETGRFGRRAWSLAAAGHAQATAAGMCPLPERVHFSLIATSLLGDLKLDGCTGLLSPMARCGIVGLPRTAACPTLRVTY
jgi:hypothetical protein